LHFEVEFAIIRSYIQGLEIINMKESDNLSSMIHPGQEIQESIADNLSPKVFFHYTYGRRGTNSALGLYHTKRLAEQAQHQGVPRPEDKDAFPMRRIIKGEKYTPWPSPQELIHGIDDGKHGAPLRRPPVYN